MRVLAFALVAGVLLVPTAGGAPGGLKLLVREGSHVTLVGRQTVTAGPYRPLAFSGDGRLVSIGGWIVGHAKLPTRALTWAPTGERAAYVTTQGGVVEWTPSGKRFLEPNGWGASWGLAWSNDGALAASRGEELWVIREGSAQRAVGPLPSACCTGGGDIPVPFAWVGDHVLWWDWPGSGSIAADGVALFEDDTKLGTTLMYPDYTAVCGTHVAFTLGGDRYSTDGKSLVFDGRTVAKDPRWSWTMPACTPDGRLVAARSRNIVPQLTTETHRSIWQLLPARKQLTRPPWGWSDESPRLLANGDVLFVRSRDHSVKQGDTWLDSQTGRVMLLSHGTLVQVATIGFRNLDLLKVPLDEQYYGHYDWTQFLAVHA